MSWLLKDVGTIEWCRATKGVLSRSERWRFTSAVLIEAVRSLPRMLLAKTGLGRRGLADPSAFSPPDTALTRRVLDACASLDPMFVQHGYRSYLFGRALGASTGLECDDEALFVACILHDYAFPAAGTVDDHCFALAGAEVAAELLRESTLSQVLQHDVLDGITLHLNPRVTPEQGVLQHLLHDGVMIDTVGTRAWELDRGGMQRVVDRHPRHAFLHRADPGLRAHARRLPSSRTGQLYRCGFGAAIHLSPWNAVRTSSTRGGSTLAAPRG